MPKHAAVIRKRMNTLRSTIRSKQQRRENGAGHSHGRSDVRNIFNAVGGPRSQETSVSSGMIRLVSELICLPTFTCTLPSSMRAR